MTSPRFFSPSFSTGFLPEPESKHAAQVLRLGPGDTLTVFDGLGTEAKARVTSASKDRVSYEILARAKSPEPRLRVHLGQAIPKGKSMDLILQKATELGASVITPILAERSVVDLDEERASAKQEKWQTTVLEACKQCGQNWLPRVAAPMGVADFLADLPKTGLRLIASLQPDARPMPHVLREAWATAPLTEVILMIGPEGDFTPAELGRARAAGFLPVSLGPHVLRTETASIFCLAALLYESLAHP
ncbi:MAG: 16S rRNA (uracil(1498)-N(3))-methyltransferase [Candidatus Methylacidiphilales bacterium]